MLTLGKHHGLGNDFLIVLDPPGDVVLDGDLARRLCDRRRGFGADGLIVAGSQPVPAGGDPAEAHLTMVLYNADGSRAELSGNGLRCLAHAEALRRGRTHLVVHVTTDAGARRAEVAPGPVPGTADVEVTMGAVTSWDPPPGPLAEAVAAAGAGRATAADAGNPHVVLEVPDPAAVDLARVGAALDRATPGGTNVEVVAPASGGLALRVWERGAGLTEACGSGAVAGFAAARGWGLVGDAGVVRMPGGEVSVSCRRGDGTDPGVVQYLLRGPASVVGSVVVDAAWLAAGG